MMNHRDHALELVHHGLLDPYDLALMAIKYMSSDDVADMLDCNELSPRFTEDYDDE